MKPLAFLHISKAAGTSMREMIKEAKGYEPSEVVTYLGAATAPERTPIITDATKFVTGHFNYGPEADYFTFLRNSPMRLLSYYNYARDRRNRHFLWKRIRRMTFSKFLVSFEECNNGMVRALTGNLSVYNLHEKEPVPFGFCPKEMLDEAIANLDDFLYVGIQEKFNFCVGELGEILNVDLVEQQMNQSGAGATVKNIKHPELSTIHKFNKLDLKLYDYISERFK